ncbi:MAG TPA: GNAT family N-acetyltransferase [Thermoanaerobaculia bacterium]|nr:GNAT family N-acetyltransferase [Thermoanaerobaculia bacterium]
MIARGNASGEPSGAAIEIGVAATAEEIAAVRELLLEYERDIGVDLCFQGFAAELDRLPGEYAPPRGRLLIARTEEGAAGCIALRPLGGGACEMKRLYVRPSFRATGLGRALAERILAEARTIGYARMCLDTLSTMARAQSLYEKLGFRDVPPYRENPIAGTRFMGLDL